MKGSLFKHISIVLNPCQPLRRFREFYKHFVPAFVIDKMKKRIPPCVLILNSDDEKWEAGQFRCFLCYCVERENKCSLFTPNCINR